MCQSSLECQSGTANQRVRQHAFRVPCIPRANRSALRMRSPIIDALYQRVGGSCDRYGTDMTRANGYGRLPKWLLLYEPRMHVVKNRAALMDVTVMMRNDKLSTISPCAHPDCFSFESMYTLWCSRTSVQFVTNILLSVQRARRIHLHTVILDHSKSATIQHELLSRRQESLTGNRS